MLSVYLDGNIVTQEPIGLSKLKEHLYYSEELSAYLLEVDGDLNFKGDAYQYIREKFNDAICNEITLLITDSDGGQFEGIIKVADCEFFPNIIEVKCEIQDNNITALIDNNKSIDCVLNVGRSKNDTPYSVVIQTDISIPNPSNTSSVVNRYGMRIFDALNSVVRFITDGELGVVSDFYDYNSNTDEQVYGTLMTGNAIRTGAVNQPTISFFELFGDLAKIENLAMGFEDGNLRIEPKSWFKQGSSGLVFESVAELSQILDESRLYAKVRFGSYIDADINSLNNISLPDIRFNGTREEQYHLGGQCNVDTELDLLLTALVIDTNLIQDILPVAQGGTNNNGYDDDVFLVQLNDLNTPILNPKPGSPTQFYFNDHYTNKRISIRWFGSIPQSIYAFLGAGNDGIDINQSADQNPVYPSGFQPTQSSPLPWNDVNNNYSIATRAMPLSPMADNDSDYPLLSFSPTCGFYTAPANAVYSFQFEMFVSEHHEYFIQKMHANNFAQASVGIGYYAEEVEELYPGRWRIAGGASFYLNAGEYVGVIPINGIYAQTIFEGSTLRVSDPLGGVWQTYDAGDVYAVINQMKYPIALNDWLAIKSQPYKSIRITHQDGEVDTWLKDISRSIVEGDGDEKMLSKRL